MPKPRGSTNGPPHTKMRRRQPKVRVSVFTWLIGVIALAALIWLIVNHFGEVEQFIKLSTQAQPQWLIVALLCQLGTYTCTGTIWYQVAESAGYTLRIP